MKFIETAAMYNQFAILPSIGIIRGRRREGPVDDSSG